MLFGVGQSSRVMGSRQEDVKLSPQEIMSLCMAVQCHHLGCFSLERVRLCGNQFCEGIKKE